MPLNPFFFFSPEKYGELEGEGGHNETRFRRLNAADIFLFSERANELLPPRLDSSPPSRDPILPIEDKWLRCERATGIGNTETSADSFHEGNFVECAKWLMQLCFSLLLQMHVVRVPCGYVF